MAIPDLEQFSSLSNPVVNTWQAARRILFFQFIVHFSFRDNAAAVQQPTTRTRLSRKTESSPAIRHAAFNLKLETSDAVSRLMSRRGRQHKSSALSCYLHLLSGEATFVATTKHESFEAAIPAAPARCSPCTHSRFKRRSRLI